MARITDLKENPPTQLPHLTKDAMLSYVKNYGTNEDIDWYIDLCEKNLITKKNNLTNENITTPDIRVLRKEFAKRFFPNLLEEKKTTTKAQSYMDRVRALRNK